MSIVAPNEDGEVRCNCDGNHFILVHDGSKVLLKQDLITYHTETATGSPNSIEYFDTEQDRDDRITELGLEV